MTITKQQRRIRTRAKVKGTSERPRLSISVTNKHLTAQIIDDDAGRTLAYATTVKAGLSGPMTQRAAWLGERIAEAAQKHKIKRVVFDRGPKIYHGRLKEAAEAARKSGLEF